MLPRTGTNTTHYNTQGLIDYTEDPTGNRTTHTYEQQTGRRIEVTDALTNTTYSAYDIQGRVTNAWGAAYPVAYAYDSYGRMIEMTTWRDTGTSGDNTHWCYDEATGLLTNKQDAAGLGAVYTYTPSGKLASRQWARGITTDYSYDSSGNLTNISYSDGTTPDVSYTYHRTGRQKTISDALGVRSLSYNSTKQLISDSNTYETIQYSIDELGRPAGVAAGNDYAATYRYDSVGRFSAVTSSLAGTFTYTHLPNSDLLAGISS